MPMGDGFFVHQKTLQIVRIQEHATAVKEQPETFGISANRVKLLLPDVNRTELVLLALRKGWVRVRSWKGGASFEGWGSWKGIGKVVRLMGDNLSFGPYTFVTVTNIKSNQGFQTNWAEIDANTRSELSAFFQPKDEKSSLESIIPVILD